MSSEDFVNALEKGDNLGAEDAKSKLLNFMSLQPFRQCGTNPETAAFNETLLLSSDSFFINLFPMPL